MANYNVTITNGQGSANMKAGSYNVTATEAQGYDLTSLSPTTFTATTEAGTQTFTLSASGTLKFNVLENNTGARIPITSGTIVMTDQTGSVQYGEVVQINSSGQAIFNNIPYGTIDTPYTLYFKQLTTDETHNIYDGVIIVNMSQESQSQNILNKLVASQSFTVTDANYSGLPVNSATLSFEENS